MATKKKAKTTTKKTTETDSAYLLKLVMYLIVGSLWIKISKGDNQLPIPIGFIVGMLFVIHDHFQIDRKIEFALLLVAMMVGFWAPIGLYITL